MDRVIDVGVGVAMCRAEQGLAKRLDLPCMFLDLRAEHVGEHVAIDIADDREAIANKFVPNTAALGIAHEVGLDTEIVAEIDVKLSASTENVKAGDGRKIGVHIDERETHGNF